MIKVTIQVEINDMIITHEKEVYDYKVSGGNTVLDAEKAQKLLLEGYHKVNKGIESQK